MAASGPAHSASRLGVLDGLRGVAVLLMLWYHVWEISFLPAPTAWLQFVPETGFVGVHLFFFLSGFVISYPFIAADAAGLRPPSWGDFAWRRSIKIVPSYLLCIAVAYALGYAQRQPNASPWPDLATHLLFIHTWFPLRFGTINGVLWTLSVEVEFYVVFPLVWWCLRRRPWLTAAGMIAIAWLWRAAWAHCCDPVLFAIYEENLPGYLDLFGIGAVCAHLFVRYGDAVAAYVRRSPVYLGWIAPVVSLLGVTLFVALLQNLYAFRLAPQWSSVWQIDGRPLLGIAFFIIAFGFLVSPPRWQLLLNNPPLRFLAAISYNLYLYHQLIARELLAWHVPSYVGDPHYDPQWQTRYTGIASFVTIAQATLVTYGFERPLLRLRPRWLAASKQRELQRPWDDDVNAAAASSKRQSP